MGKRATTVMEFIPNAQNITQVLNRGPAMEAQVLSSANALGLPYEGRATGRVNIAHETQTVCRVCALHRSLY